MKWAYFTALFFGFGFLGILVYFIRQETAKSARLAALKQEIKERERAQSISDNVRNMPIDRVRQQLKQTK